MPNEARQIAADLGDSGTNAQVCNEPTITAYSSPLTDHL